MTLLHNQLQPLLKCKLCPSLNEHLWLNASKSMTMYKHVHKQQNLNSLRLYFCHSNFIGNV